MGVDIDQPLAKSKVPKKYCKNERFERGHSSTRIIENNITNIVFKYEKLTLRALSAKVRSNPSDSALKAQGNDLICMQAYRI